ncbi:MAG: class I SAM-dependent methyltransferase [Myxococcota bacterium]
MSSPADAPGRCRLCGGAASAIRPFGRRVAEETFLSRCERCAAEFLDPQPSSAWLAEEYRDYYARRATLLESPKRAFFEELLDLLACDFSKRCVMDVGAAEGELIAALGQRWPEARAFALEAHPDARPFLERLGCRYASLDVVDWLAERSPERFDFIFLFDVIEHLRDPLEVVRDLAQHHLRPSGTIVASFPMATSASRRILGRLWPQYKLEHLFYLSPGAVSRLEEAAGLCRRTLRPLHKKLSLAYFLAVGSRFGPAPTRRACRLAERILPSALSRWRAPLGIGESLWIAAREGAPHEGPTAPSKGAPAAPSPSAQPE